MAELDLTMESKEDRRHVQDKQLSQNYILIQNLIRAGVPSEEAYQVAPLLKKVQRSPDEEALVKKVWLRVRSQ
ncbi:hypothetical protein IQ230_26080 [Gloeocapsopsis crepidinum LEGE 06123]|uniref:Uncharacterized protein n=1 Tax=Gloeocapsopsis crepidinum LEGE 06123 TaxID=588587 RepID=A0ABR9UZG8_9CHRO|nr:hypothetical protein [Gloeocapsopsis crepidinum]MBE9193712.1 hypothetical protein [Gloeocapsopsis crepidinum LEGE 06123]